MKFGEKLKEQRKKRGLLQEDVAVAVGITKRTLQSYEWGKSYPKDRDVYHRLAKFFDVDINYFLTEDEEFITTAAEKFGRRGKEQAESVIAQAAALFAGGELSEEDQIAFVHEIQGLFLDSKQRARDKFTPKKYRGKSQSESE